NCPDDDSARWRLDRFDDLLEPAAFFVVADALGDADVIDGGHVDDVPPRQRDVARHPRALRPDWALGDLNGELLPFFEHLADGRLARDAISALRGFICPVVLAALFGDFFG